MDRWTTPLFSILISVLNSSYLDFVLELQPPSTDPDLSYVSLTLRLVLGFFPSLKLLGMNLGLPLKILKGFLRNMWEHFIRLGHIHTSCHVVDNVVQPYAGEILSDSPSMWLFGLLDLSHHLPYSLYDVVLEFLLEVEGVWPPWVMKDPSTEVGSQVGHNCKVNLHDLKEPVTDRFATIRANS